MDRTVGTCSNCGGRVTVPEAWLCIYPPIPTCEKCYATVKHEFGPRIPMNPPKRDVR